MKTFEKSLFVLAAAMLLAGCNGSGKKAAAKETEAADAVMAETMAETPKFSGKTAIGVFHEVADFVTWEKAYLKKSDKEARIGYLQMLNKPNMVAVFHFSESHDAARQMLSSEDLKNAMKASGVKGEPEIQLYDMQFMLQEQVDPNQVRMLAKHEVQDYDKWKTVFDADESSRAEAGLTLIGLARGADNANMIYMMFGVQDPAKVEAMMGSEEMKKKMKDAGVIGKPEVTMWTVPMPAPPDDAAEI